MIPIWKILIRQNYSNMNKKIIVAIDPGALGGIAVWKKDVVTAVKMPKSITETHQYLKYLESIDDVIVLIEKVQAYKSDDDAPGKKFGINKLLANYNELLSMLKIEKFEFIEVHPTTWQNELGLKLDKSISGEEPKTVRKNRFKQYAQRIFPQLKVNLQTSDALCLLRFYFVKRENDLDWLRQRVQNRKKNTLF